MALNAIYCCISFTFDWSHLKRIFRLGITRLHPKHGQRKWVPHRTFVSPSIYSCYAITTVTRFFMHLTSNCAVFLMECLKDKPIADTKPFKRPLEASVSQAITGTCFGPGQVRGDDDVVFEILNYKKSMQPTVNFQLISQT